MTFSDEMLMAYVDGEMSGAHTEALEKAIARDPELAARVERQRKLRHALAAAYEPVLKEPMPERLLSAARGAAHVHPARTASALHWGWLEWGAMAASVTLGIFVGSVYVLEARRTMPAYSGTADFLVEDGRVVAHGALAHALSEALTSTQSPEARPRIGMTFLSRAGSYCRTFALVRAQASAPLTGLACKEANEWRVHVIAEGGRVSGAGAEYRPAAAAMPPAVVRTVEELIQGAAFDAQAEREARARGWAR